MPSDTSHDDMLKFVTSQNPHDDGMPEVELHALQALRCWFCLVWQRCWEN